MTNTDTQYTTPIPIIITDGTLIPTVDKNGVRNVMKRTGSGPWWVSILVVESLRTIISCSNVYLDIKLFIGTAECSHPLEISQPYSNPERTAFL